MRCFEVHVREHCGSVSQKWELLEARRKVEHFQGQRRNTAAVPAWRLPCVLLREQKEKGYGFFSHFMQSIASVEAGWRLSFSAGAEASPHLSFRGQDIPVCHWTGCPERPVPGTGGRAATCTTRGLKKPQTSRFSLRLTCRSIAVVCALPTRATSASAC